MTSLLRFLLLGLLGHSLAQASLNVSSQRSNLSSVYETTAKTVQSFVEESFTTLGRKETTDCIVEFEAGSFLALVDSILPETWTEKYIQPMAERSGVATGKHTALCAIHDPPLVETYVADHGLGASLIELHNTTPCSSDVWAPNPIMSAVHDYMREAKYVWENAIEWTITTWSEVISAEYWTVPKSTAESSAQLDANVLDDFSDFLDKNKSSLESAIKWTVTKWSELDSAENWTAATSIVVDSKSSAQLDANVLGDFSDFLDKTKSSLESAIKWTVTKWSELDSAENWTAAKSIVVDSKSSAQLDANVLDDFSDFLDKTKSCFKSAIGWAVTKWSELDSTEYWTAAKSTADTKSSAQLDANVLDDFTDFLDNIKSSLENAIQWTITTWSKLDSAHSVDWTTPKSTTKAWIHESLQMTSNMLDDVREIVDMAKSSFESAKNWTTSKWSEVNAGSDDWSTAKCAAAHWSSKSPQLASDMLDYFSEIQDLGKSSFNDVIEWASSKLSEIDSETFDWTQEKSLESATTCPRSEWPELERRILDWTTTKSTQTVGLFNTSFTQITTSISNFKTTANWSPASFVKIVGKFELKQAKSFLGSLTNWNNMQYSLVVQHCSSLEWHRERAKALAKYFVDWTKRQYALIKSHWSAIMGDDRLSLDPKSIWDSMWDGSGQLVKLPSWLRFLNATNDPDLAWEIFLKEANRQVVLARQERQRMHELILLRDRNRAALVDPEIV